MTGCPASLGAVQIPVSNPRGEIFLGSNPVRIEAAFKIFDTLFRESAFELTLPCLDTVLNSAPPDACCVSSLAVRRARVHSDGWGRIVQRREDRQEKV